MTFRSIRRTSIIDPMPAGKPAGVGSSLSALVKAGLGVDQRAFTHASLDATSNTLAFNTNPRKGV